MTPLDWRSLMFQIEPVYPDDWTIALELALAHVPADQRPLRVQQCVNMLMAGVLDPRGVFVARVDREIVGAQVCVPIQGAACLFWLPTAADACAEDLVQYGLDWCRSIECKLAQALAKPDEMERAAVLMRNDFRRITRLEQWGRDLVDLPKANESTWRLERYRPALAHDFAATVSHTYEGTLDCPELNGVRTIDEIMAGHRAQGKFHADFWWLAYVNNAPAAVLLLAEMADGTTWELAYLGVAPEHRGRGLARNLLASALHALCEQPAVHVVLAVDERNRPARRLYESLGFVQTETSDVYLFVF